MDVLETISQDDLELLARVREGDSDLLADALGLERLKDRALIRLCAIVNTETGEPVSLLFAHPTAEGYEALGMPVQRVRRAS